MPTNSILVIIRKRFPNEVVNLIYIFFIGCCRQPKELLVDISSFVNFRIPRFRECAQYTFQNYIYFLVHSLEIRSKTFWLRRPQPEWATKEMIKPINTFHSSFLDRSLLYGNRIWALMTPIERNLFILDRYK